MLIAGILITRRMQIDNIRMRVAINNMSQGLCMFDGDERLVVCNRRYMDLYQLPDEVVKPGRTLASLLEFRIANGSFSRDPDEYRQGLVAAMAQGKTTTAEVKSASGRVVAVINRPMADGGWVATHEDITERRDAERERASMQEQQERRSIIEQAIAAFRQRDYYTKTDAKSEEIRKKYVAHVQQMLELAGDSRAQSAKEALAIMRIETALAKASLTRVEQRDPYKLFHKMDRTQLQALTPALNWTRYLKASGLGDLNEYNVTEPAFFKELQALLTATALDQWKAYMRWHLVHARAAYLSAAFVQANFEFFGKYLRGTPEQRPRWKRCVQYVDGDLGEALGQVFVERTFGPDMKARTLTMTKEIEKAMEDDIKQLPWMSEATRQQALLKLHSVTNKIGYPDKWRDYSSIRIERGDFAGNVYRAAVFEGRRQLAKIGKPVDRGEWGMTPPTVNAYYDPQMNDINFPAGVLPPPES